VQQDDAVGAGHGRGQQRTDEQEGGKKLAHNGSIGLACDRTKRQNGARSKTGDTMTRGPRLAVRAVILRHGRLLIVNAYPGQQSDLWCAPGGGVKRGTSLPENLAREVFEETGLAIAVGAPCLVNEFHDPESGFHQVDVYFHATVTGGVKVVLDDPERVVNRFQWVTETQLRGLRFKPDSLPDVAFGAQGLLYDPLEPILR